MTIQEMIEFLEIEGFTVPWNGTEIRAAKDGSVKTHYRGRPASQGRSRYGRMEFTDTWTPGRPATPEEIKTLTDSLEEEVQRRQGAVAYVVSFSGRKTFLDNWKAVEFFRKTSKDEIVLLQPEPAPTPAQATPATAPAFDSFEEECDPGDYDY